MTAKLKTISLAEIEVAISDYYGTRKHIIVPNLSWGFVSHEVDIAVITKAGYLKEIEIKRSKTDFLSDFKKRHHHIERNNKINEFYYAFPEEVYEKCKDLIPENAGVLVCKIGYKDKLRIIKVKDAVKIKGSRKLTMEEQFKVAKLGTMRIFNLKRKIINLQ